MDLKQAVEFIRPAVLTDALIWADIGAGSGLFTMALCALVPNVKIYAVDKNPHILWSLTAPPGSMIDVIEGDFNGNLDIPIVDGMIMANTLHYARDAATVLENVTEYLAPGGSLLLIEYETSQANQWVPFPIGIEKFREACVDAGLSDPEVINTYPTRYGHEHMYLARTMKEK